MLVVQRAGNVLCVVFVLDVDVDVDVEGESVFSKPMVVLRSLVGVLCSGQEVYLPPPERNVKGDSANGTQPMSQTLCFPRKEQKSSK